ncbi:ParB/RepB/Spo0J family partition protein [Aquamicrobium sp.]|uniref:ParB/RepB/Spo0J family partition protein n=1 Tax=Aquamicrobium sp. TaxID=1872579 RepID=UPI00258CCE14|nr:ParB/RepB/Spo0J family partition protein [Aquamicrobium sp.]MCK9549484.1 ParB/RepB/Spo0J family partition protein [Aquamicrobium sp.]
MSNLKDQIAKRMADKNAQQEVAPQTLQSKKHATKNEQNEQFAGELTGHKEIKIDLLDPNPFQNRLGMDEMALFELKKNIEETGLIHPITVHKDGNRYIVVAGHRRVEAFKLMRKTKIPAIVYENLNDLDLTSMCLVENISRENLDPIEISIALNAALSQNMTQVQLANKLGKDTSFISKHVSLIKLNDDIISDLKKNKNTKKDYRALSTIAKEKDVDRQNYLYQGFISNGRDWLENNVKNIKTPSNAQSRLDFNEKKDILIVKNISKELTEDKQKELFEMINVFLEKNKREDADESRNS